MVLIDAPQAELWHNLCVGIATFAPFGKEANLIHGRHYYGSG